MWLEGLRAKFPSAALSSSPSSYSPEPFGRKEFDNLLGEYEVVSDAPSIVFSEELIDLYPEAKVIIVKRDVDAWYESFYNTVVAKTFGKVVYAITALDPTVLAYAETNRYCFRGYFHAQNQKEMEQNAKRVHKDHYEMIRRVTPKERLLDYKLGMGWEPLCAFLGKEVPREEFPRINDLKDFDARANIMIKIAAGRILKKALYWLAGFGALAAGVGWYYTRSQSPDKRY